MEAKAREGKRIRKGDHVMAIAGNDRGRSGLVIARKGDRLIVQGLNVHKRHIKKTKERPGSISSLEAPIHASNLRLCTEQGKPLTTHMKVTKKGQRELVYEDGGQEKVYRSIKKPK